MEKRLRFERVALWSRSRRSVLCSRIIYKTFIAIPSLSSFQVDITVVSKQLGSLQIGGLCFDWIYPSLQHLDCQNQGALFSAGNHSRVNGDIPPNSVSAAHSSHIPNDNSMDQTTGERGRSADSNSVRGKIYLSDCKDNLIDLNGNSMDHSPGQLPLPSHLTWTITHPSALLRVSFTHIFLHKGACRKSLIRIRLREQVRPGACFFHIDQLLWIF